MVVDNGDVGEGLDEWLVELVSEEGHSCNDEVVFGMSFCNVKHWRQGTLEFLFAASGEQGNERSGGGMGEVGGGLMGFVLLNGIEKGMAYINSLREVVTGIEVLFERKDVAKAVEVFAHGTQTSFFPSP